MSRVTTRDTVPEDRLARILAPRDDAVVRETVDGQGFEADSGPFDAYRRTVTMERRDDGSADVEQVVTFRLALPVFGPLVVPLFRSHLRRLEPRQKAPWWAPVERIDPPAARTLAGLGTVAVVIGYVLTVLPQTITFAASQFHADKTAQGVALASTRADIVFVIVLVALADRHGRQRLLLLSTALASVFTALGALAPSLAWLAVTQVGASGCGSAAVVLIAIMAAEAMPRSARAYALSLLTVVGSIGIGALLGLLFIADFSRGSWRVLYAIGIVGVPLVIAIGRRLPESPRYLAPHADAPLAGHGRRLWLLAIAGLLINVFIAPSSDKS